MNHAVCTTGQLGYLKKWRKGWCGNFGSLAGVIFRSLGNTCYVTECCLITHDFWCLDFMYLFSACTIPGHLLLKTEEVRSQILHLEDVFQI